MSRFTLPRDIYHGKGCLEELKNLKGRRAFLVTGGGSMKRQGFLDKAAAYLDCLVYTSQGHAGRSRLHQISGLVLFTGSSL